MASQLRSVALATVFALAQLGPATAGNAAKTMSATITPQEQQKIDAIFAPYASGGPGCVLGITKDLKTVYEKGYGVANLDYDAPMSPDTSFDIASVSKQFTAMAVIILARDGKISLDDDVRRYVPEVPDYGTTITIKDLIHHTSGLRDIYMLRTLMGLTEKDYFSEEEFLDIVARQKHPTFETGTTFRYSNTGYLMLALVIKRVTGKTLAQYAKAKIFEPLGMTRSFFHDDVSRVVKNRATGYYGDKAKGFTRGVTLFEMVGDGGVTTTVGDLMLWDRDYYKGKVWRQDTKADMLAPGRFKNGEPVVYPGEPGAFYAGGVVVGERRGLGFVRHGGSFVGFKTDQLRFPTVKLGITLLCNLGGMDANGLSNQVADVLLEHAYQIAAPVPEADSGEMPPKPTPISSDILEAMPGTYRSEELRTSYRVARRGDTLDIFMGPREVLLDFKEFASSAISQLGEDTVGDEVFVFKLTRDGKRISGFEMSLAGASPFRFERIK